MHPTRGASSATARKMRHKTADFPRNRQKQKDIENAQKFAAFPEHASQTAATTPIRAPQTSHFPIPPSGESLL
jgi:hypothetical protein